MKSYKDLIYVLLCLCLSIVIGAGLYEHLAIWPQVMSAPPQSLTIYQGDYRLNAGAFWPVIHPIILLLFITNLILTWKSERRMHVLIPFVGYILIMVVTAIYFVPELVAITSSEFSNTIDQQLVERASRWEILSLIRQLIGIAIAIYLLLGLTKANTKLAVQ